MWYHITVDKPRRFTLAQTHTPPGIVRAGCLRGRGAHKLPPHPAHKRVRLFLTQPRVLARLCRPFVGVHAPALEGGRGVGDTTQQTTTKGANEPAKSGTDAPPYPFPRTPYGSGEGGNANKQVQTSRTTRRRREAASRPTHCTKCPYFVRAKTSCKQTALARIVYKLFCAGRPAPCAAVI